MNVRANANDLASVQATVYGYVQRVFFRAFVARRASELGLAGYVRNLPRGTVEVLAEGERKRLEELLSHLKVGPLGARVEKVVTNWSGYTGNYADFNIRH